MQSPATRCGMAHLLHRQRPLLFVLHLNAVPSTSSSLYWPWTRPWRPRREECRRQRLFKVNILLLPTRGGKVKTRATLTRDSVASHFRVSSTLVVRCPFSTHASNISGLALPSSFDLLRWCPCPCLHRLRPRRCSCPCPCPCPPCSSRPPPPSPNPPRLNRAGRKRCTKSESRSSAGPIPSRIARRRRMNL